MKTKEEMEILDATVGILAEGIEYLSENKKRRALRIVLEVIQTFI